jgi:transcriptional regulator with XRE-family HTH domain
MTTEQRAASLGLQIRAARKAAGLTQVELAALLDVDQGQVSRTERGDKMPTVVTLIRFAKALDATFFIGADKVTFMRDP